MRIIIELDAGNTTPDLQITTQGKPQSQGAETTSSKTTSGSVTDAGGPKYMSSGESTQQPSNTMPVSSMPAGSVTGTGAGAAPAEEG